TAAAASAGSARRRAARAAIQPNSAETLERSEPLEQDLLPLAHPPPLVLERAAGQRVVQRGRELGQRSEHERIAPNVLARQATAGVHGRAEQQQVEVERTRREALGAPQAAAFVLDVVELVLDVVGRAVRRERD